MKINDLEARNGIIGNSTTSLDKGFFISYENYNATFGDKQLRFTSMKGVQGQYNLAKGAQNTINDMNWHHIAVVGDGPTIQFYVDGTADGEPTNLSHYATGTSTRDFSLGRAGIGQQYLNGSIDEVHVFNLALTAAEIQQLAQKQTPQEIDAANSQQLAANSSFGQYYKYGFQGEFVMESAETGYNDFQYRSWDPVVSRWISPDPARQYWSPFMGMGNNPMNQIDSDGAYSKFGALWRSGFGLRGRAYQSGVDNGREVWGYERNGTHYFGADARTSGYRYTLFGGNNSFFGNIGSGFSQLGNNLWHSNTARYLIPDVLTLDASAGAALIIGGQKSATLSLITRGPDAGFYTTETFTGYSLRATDGSRYGLDFDAGINIGTMSFRCDSRDLRAGHLIGRTRSTSAGFGVGANYVGGINNQGHVIMHGASYGVGITAGASRGVGYTNFIGGTD